MTDDRLEKIMSELRGRSNPAAREGMARYGIDTATALGGTSIPQLRATARAAGRDHALAAALWATGVHEARLLATMVDDPSQVTERQMDSWTEEFCSWDLCDQCCTNLFRLSPFAWSKAFEYTLRPEEYVKRAGFVLMAVLAVHDKIAVDQCFIECLEAIDRECEDPRNYVRKAVNWALRQIGKRSPGLNAVAVERAEMLLKRESKAARWIAADALRELRSEAVQARLQARARP